MVKGMDMLYTTDDRLPRLRAQVVRMVRSGKSTRKGKENSHYFLPKNQITFSVEFSPFFSRMFYRRG